MKYNIVKDGKVVVTVSTIDEARSLVKLLGYGYEIVPEWKNKNEDNQSLKVGRWHI